MTTPSDNDPGPAAPNVGNDGKPDAVSVTPTSKALRKASLLEVYFPFGLKDDSDAIYIASFPPIIYFWPSMLIFFLCGVLQKVFGVDPGALGMTAVMIFAFNVLVTVQDFDQKKFLIFLFALIAIFLSLWLMTAKGIVLPERIGKWILNLNPTFSTDAYFMLFTVLLIYFCWGMLHPIFDYWRFEQNEFIHYVQPMGRDMSVPRMGSTVSKDNPDVLESLLTLGGGSIVVKREGQIVATIPHVPFLGLRMRALEKMLSETRVISIQN